MISRFDFSEKVVRELITDLTASILVVAGDENDRDILSRIGFKNVVISNIDTRKTCASIFYPYSWNYQNAHVLTYKDMEFDYVVVNAALHHCSSPHRALLEMYRVARIGVLAFEGRDGFLIRFLRKIGFAQTYEWAGVFCFGGDKSGGVDNTEVPNYVYRWTEREIEKTINAYAPYANHKFIYRYGFSPPTTQNLFKNGSIKRFIISFFLPVYKLCVGFFPKQQNLFGFFIFKPSLSTDLLPWLALKDGCIQRNKEWVQKVKVDNEIK